MLHRKLIVLCLFLTVTGCTSIDSRKEISNPDGVAATFAKASTYIFSSDFVGFDDTKNCNKSQNNSQIYG